MLGFGSCTKTVQSNKGKLVCNRFAWCGSDDVTELRVNYEIMQNKKWRSGEQISVREKKKKKNRRRSELQCAIVDKKCKFPFKSHRPRGRWIIQILSINRAFQWNMKRSWKPNIILFKSFDSSIKFLMKCIWMLIAEGFWFFFH